MLFLPLQPAERLNELLAMADLHLLPQHKGVADLVMPSKLGGMLASGRPLVVAADPGSELFEVLNDVALLTPTGDDAALAAAIEQAVARDLSDRVNNGLRLAGGLSSARLLPRFERLLLEHVRLPAPVVEVQQATKSPERGRAAREPWRPTASRRGDVRSFSSKAATAAPLGRRGGVDESRAFAGRQRRQGRAAVAARYFLERSSAKVDGPSRPNVLQIFDFARFPVLE